MFFVTFNGKVSTEKEKKASLPRSVSMRYPSSSLMLYGTGVASPIPTNGQPPIKQHHLMYRKASGHNIRVYHNNYVYVCMYVYV